MKSVILPTLHRLRAKPVSKENRRRWVRGIALTAFSVLLPQAALFGRFSPFAAALIAAVPLRTLPVALGGTLIGECIAQQGFSVLWRIAAVLIATAIRWIFSEWNRISEQPFFPPIVAFCAVVLPETIGAKVMHSGSGLFFALLQGLLAAIGAFCFFRIRQMLCAHLSPADTSLSERLCVLTGMAILLLALFPLRISVLSLGHCLALSLMLFFCIYGKTACGSIAGAGGGLLFLLSGTSPTALLFAPICTFGGLAASFGRLFAVGAFVLGSSISVLLVPDTETVWLYESVIAAVLVLLMPNRWIDRATARFFPSPPAETPDFLRRTVTEKLKNASESVLEIATVADEVSKKLFKADASSVQAVYEQSVDEVCRGCALRVSCWQKNYFSAMDALNRSTEALFARGFLGREDLPEPLRSKCIHPARLAACISTHYRTYLGSQEAAKRLNDLRAVIGTQFSGVGEILQSFSEAFSDSFAYDRRLEDALRLHLQGEGYEPTEILCRLGAGGRMVLELTFDARADCVPTAEQQERLLSVFGQICGRAFGNIAVSRSGTHLCLRCTEETPYRVHTAHACHACNGTTLCGDQQDFFYDGLGHAIALLSDGMGSGGRAAVDSSVACGIFSRMVRAGLGFDSTLRILNAALYTRAEEESPATLDVACINLHSGSVLICKAGAPTSYVRRNGVVSRVDLPSLPIGILREIRFAKGNIPLSADDTVLLVSDGASSEGDEWICQILQNWNGTLQELCDSVVQRASSLRPEQHDDDISAIALQLKAG